MVQHGYLAVGVAFIGAVALSGCAAPPPRLAAPAPAVSALQAAPAPAGGTAAPAAPDVAQSVLFSPDSADLTPDARRQLAGWAAVLRGEPDQPVTIVGHGDTRSTREYSIALGAARAQAVKTYLVALGVPAGRLSTTSLGLERPAAPGFSPEARSLDRRASLVFESLAAVPP